MITDSDILAAVREALPGVRRLYLFGSRAVGEERPDSDLDIAVVLNGRADPVSLWKAGEAVASRLDVDVDLIDLLAADTVLKYQIVTTGRRLFAVDPMDAERYEIFILNDMMDLNEIRAPLIAELKRGGKDSWSMRLLSILRACGTYIDIGQILVRRYRLGLCQRMSADV